MAISCSWCKAAYHNKDSCFNKDRFKESCSLGIIRVAVRSKGGPVFTACPYHAGTNRNIIVPPSWIVKLPGRESFKSSLRKSPRSKKDRGSTRRKKGAAEDKPENSPVPKSFVVKPIPLSGSRPIIVFINPKSGGNQGAKLMQKFQWLLNPRQVFDLTQGGPKAGYVSLDNNKKF